MLAVCPAVQRAFILCHLPLAAGFFKSLLFHSCLTASLALVCSTLMYLVTHYGCPPKPRSMLHNTTGFDKVTLQ